MTIQNELIIEIKRFLAKHRMAESRFGRDCLDDPKFLFQFFAGKRSPKLATVEKIKSFMKKKR